MEALHTPVPTPNSQSARSTPHSRPTPNFYFEPQTFSTKKERRTPRDHPPPRPPIKSAPPISRIFQQRIEQKAQPVSFRSSQRSFLLSSQYNENSKELFFDQVFEIECKIGAGSFGDVFKVKSKDDGKFYAVKRSRERFRGECDRKRKLEEVAKHEQLPKHPNCVEFFKAWEEHQHLYIQTELCETSLNNFAERNHNIPENIILNYMVDLLMAVKHLHDHDLVHMDIKPENFFLSRDGFCKLGDFGLVLDLKKKEECMEAQEGDPKYLAPELLAGRVGKPADVFSLGITLLELATDLDLPRGGGAWHQLRSGRIPEDVLHGLSYDLRCIIQWMLVPDPDKRPTVDEILSLPQVIKIWKRRQREQRMSRMVSYVSSAFTAIFSFLMTTWWTLTFPIQKWLPGRMETPERRSHRHHPTEWDCSFSEDEIFDDEANISVSNNSMGIPLDSSSSSCDSDFVFKIPTKPVRRAQTTPSYRLRGRSLHYSPKSSSPVMNLTPRYGDFLSSSPVSATRHLSCRTCSEMSITPDSSFNECECAEDEVFLKSSGGGGGGGGIEPKNLMDAFESASSESD